MRASTLVMARMQDGHARCTPLPCSTSEKASCTVTTTSAGALLWKSSPPLSGTRRVAAGCTGRHECGCANDGQCHQERLNSRGRASPRMRLWVAGSVASTRTNPPHNEADSKSPSGLELSGWYQQLRLSGRFMQLASLPTRMGLDTSAPILASSMFSQSQILLSKRLLRPYAFQVQCYSRGWRCSRTHHRCRWRRGRCETGLSLARYGVSMRGAKYTGTSDSDLSSFTHGDSLSFQPKQTLRPQTLRDRQDDGGWSCSRSHHRHHGRRRRRGTGRSLVQGGASPRSVNYSGASDSALSSAMRSGSPISDRSRLGVPTHFTTTELQRGARQLQPLSPPRAM